ncbi:unnamed protein product [Durusdinium trenchii]|uniref:Uncharacterized protein n=1 Tax=Durusdinium trenchii TaxID=1381693 RepID=A0ABP0NY72_9DINO
MMTDANKPGVEKVCCALTQNSWLSQPLTQIRAHEDLGIEDVKLLSPGNAFMVKGWNRSVCCLTVCYAAYQNPHLLQARSFSTIYGTAVNSELSTAVSTNRGVTLGSSVRRKPNAFNLVHQLEMMIRGGMSREQVLGSLEECGAAVNLLQRIPSEIKQVLTLLVQKYTQPRFLNHETLSANLLNGGFCSATGILAPWKQQLTNSPALLRILVVRLEKDWLAIAPKNRRPWNLKDVDSRFELRHGDADLTQLLEGSVPPADLQRVSIFSSHIQKYYAQGALDFKHINDRFQKGKEWCSDFLERKHQLIHVNSLVLAHSTIVSAQAEMGPDGLTILVVDATLWPTRQISIDEAIQLCASVSSGNTSSVAFFCMPQCMAAICASSNSAFTKSKALLGSICDIERSRVGELQNPDPERSLAPHWRVQQRGISATSGIIKHLLEGVSSNAQQPALVCDLLPNRFSEWSLATWDLQSAFLMETNRELDLRFLGVYHSDNADELSAANEVLMGRLIADYWDGCDKAGPKTREASGFSEAFPTLQSLVVNEGEIKLPELLQQKYSQQAGLKEFLEKISADADMAAALRSYHAASNRSSPGKPVAAATTMTRTLASPEWTGDAPLNFRKPLNLDEVSMRVKICITSGNHLWLINKSGNGSVVEVPPGELFGFNVGQFQEVPLGSADPSDAHLGWVMNQDNSLVAMADTKEIKSLAEIMCDVAKHQGVTEIRIIDHSVQPKAGPDGRALAYRYNISPMGSVNAYRPKEVGSDVDRMSMRSVQLGATFNAKYSQLPKCQLCNLMWEVKVDASVPAVLKPIKPKFYLLGVITIKDGYAVKLK